MDRDSQYLEKCDNDDVDRNDDETNLYKTLQDNT